MVGIGTGILCACLLLFIAIDFALGRRAIVRKQSDVVYPLRHSTIETFNDGPLLFSRMFADIDRSRSYIHILFYIFRDDRFGETFLTLLKKKAGEGVAVRLLLDWAGSFRFPQKKIAELKGMGIEIAFSHKPGFPYFFYRIQSRNHQKLTIIDGEVGYLGCFNVGEEYVNNGKKLRPWRDYHIRYVGEGVADLDRQFCADWKRATGADLKAGSPINAHHRKGASLHYFYASTGAGLEKEIARHLSSAREEIFIGTPYFLPGKLVFRTLCTALARGVKVKVLIPKVADHPFVKEASYRFFRKLIPLGCEVYEYTDGFYHGKAIVIDETVCLLGTANCDRRSLYYNFEMNAFFLDRPTIRRIRRMIAEDFLRAHPLAMKELTGGGILLKIREVIAFLLSPLL